MYPPEVLKIKKTEKYRERRRAMELSILWVQNGIQNGKTSVPLFGSHIEWMILSPRLESSASSSCLIFRQYWTPSYSNASHNKWRFNVRYMYRLYRVTRCTKSFFVGNWIPPLKNNLRWALCCHMRRLWRYHITQCSALEVSYWRLSYIGGTLRKKTRYSPIVEVETISRINLSAI